MGVDGLCGLTGTMGRSTPSHAGLGTVSEVLRARAAPLAALRTRSDPGPSRRGADAQQNLRKQALKFSSRKA